MTKVIKDKPKCLNNSHQVENVDLLDENRNDLKKTDLYLDLQELSCNGDEERAPQISDRIPAPNDWKTLLTTFYKKHPPPEKKHVRLVNKFIPKYIQERQKLEAEILAER